MVPLDVVLCFLFRRERVEPEAIRVIDLYAILAYARVAVWADEDARL